MRKYIRANWEGKLRLLSEEELAFLDARAVTEIRVLLKRVMTLTELGCCSAARHADLITRRCRPLLSSIQRDYARPP